MQEWLLNNVLELLVLLFGGIFALATIRGQAEEMKKEFRAEAKKFEEHLQTEYPHQACRLESVKITNIMTLLQAMQAKLNQIDERILDLISNGRAK